MNAHSLPHAGSEARLGRRWKLSRIVLASLPAAAIHVVGVSLWLRPSPHYYQPPAWGLEGLLLSILVAPIVTGLSLQWLRQPAPAMTAMLTFLALIGLGSWLGFGSTSFGINGWYPKGAARNALGVVGVTVLVSLLIAWVGNHPPRK